jgi:hypothetical protein
LALASLTSGGRLVGIVRLRTTSHGVRVYTDGRTPWTGDQPVARPLHNQNKGRAVAQAVSRRFPTAASRVRTQAIWDL